MNKQILVSDKESNCSIVGNKSAFTKSINPIQIIGAKSNQINRGTESGHSDPVLPSFLSQLFFSPLPHCSIIPRATTEETNKSILSNSMAEAKIFELNNGTIQVKVSNYGCTITSLFVPDKDGEFTKSIAYQRSNRFCISTVNACSLIFFVFALWREIGWCCSWIWHTWAVSGQWRFYTKFNPFFFFCYNHDLIIFLASKLNWGMLHEDTDFLFFFWGLFYVWFSWFGCFNSVCAERCCSVFRVHCGSGCKQDQRWEVHPRWNWVLIAS